MKGFRWHLNVGSSLVSIILSSIEPTLGAILGESFHTTPGVEELFLLFYYHGRLEASRAPISRDQYNEHPVP